MKILIIEDSSEVISALRRGLRANYIIDVVHTGGDGIHEAEVSNYDAIILDLGLPDMPGAMVCRSIRALSITVPILILTAAVAVEDKVRLLDIGADDYLTKPFSLEELKARLRVIIRRDAPATGSSTLSVGDLVLDTTTRRVERSGITVYLRRKEFDLLEYLMYHQGAVVTRAMIVDHVWDVNEGLWTNAIDVHIKCLRDKVDRPFSVPLIKTVHGVGYRLEVPPAIVAQSW
jgi:two-component system, OmpR family, copper resistance phosphate regulon response regulator CusR